LLLLLLLLWHVGILRLRWGSRGIQDVRQSGAVFVEVFTFFFYVLRHGLVRDSVILVIILKYWGNVSIHY
jgi:hypothetical protein